MCLVSTVGCEGKNQNRSSVRGDGARRTQGRAATLELAHTCDEADASARERLDQSLFLAAVADFCAHGADPAAKGRVGDDPSLPHSSNELIPTDHTFAVSDQVVQQIEYLRLEGPPPTAPPQLTPPRIQHAIVKEIVHAGSSICSLCPRTTNG